MVEKTTGGVRIGGWGTPGGGVGPRAGLWGGGGGDF